MTTRLPPDRVSVIVPTRDAQGTLGPQLDSLARQSYRGDWELLIADNGSTDNSRSLAESYADRLPIRVIDASARTGVAAARNIGASKASGQLLLFCDADDILDREWLEEMVRSALEAAIVGGRLEPGHVNDPLVQAWRAPLQPPGGLASALGFLEYATGASIGVWVDVFEELEGFDETHPFGGDDVEFSWRAQLAGHDVAFAGGAITHYRYRSDLRGTLRQARLYGVADALLYRRFRQHVRRPRLRHLVKAYLRLVRRVTDVGRGPGPRGAWLRDVFNRVGRLQGSLRFRVFYP